MDPTARAPANPKLLEWLAAPPPLAQPALHEPAATTGTTDTPTATP